MLRSLLVRVQRRLRGSARIRTELDQEIRTHLELRARDLEDAGMDSEQARAEAERRFGDLEQARLRLYASARRREERLRLTQWLDSLRQDIVVGWRRITTSPGFAALSIATFALGIGLTTTMFAVLDASILRPLPYPESEQLVALYSVPEEGEPFPWVSSTNWLDWREQARTLAGTALYQADRVNVATGDETARVAAANVGGRFFESLRAPMLVGRPFSDEESDERAPVIVVSESFWREFLDADPGLGEVVVGGISRRVVGVIADRYALPAHTDIWQPAVYRRLSGAARNNINWQAVARLAPGISAETARADLDRIAAAIRSEAPEAVYSYGVGVVPLHEEVVGDAEEPVQLLGGAVLVVLLVACANLAGQAYARSLSNVEAAAVKLALGATRLRVLQHQIIEHLLLAAIGGAVGLLVAGAATRWLAIQGLPLPRADSISVDLRVASVAAAASLLAGLLAGIAPALRVARSAPRAAMSSVRGSSSGARTGAARWLVVAEVALSVLLLIGGGLLLRGFAEFVDRDLGFEPRGLLVADIELAGPDYESPDSRIEFWRRLQDEARALPGVERAALAREVPGTDRAGYGWIEIADRPAVEGAGATYRVIGEDWFETLGLPLLSGRDFDASDRADGARVAIVSRRFVELYWPEENPLGKGFRATSMEYVQGRPELTVIGVVSDLDSGLGVERRPAMYVLHRQVPLWADRLSLVLRTRGDGATALAAAVRDRVRSLDPSLATEIGTVSGHLGGILARDRLVMSLLTGFALLTLGLAAIGVHGLLAFSVARRTREIAVRSALGADRQRILTMVLGSALRIAGLGLLIGVASAWWLSGFLQAQVVGIDPYDPLLYALVAAALLTVTVGAAWLPAWRAVRQSPSDALRAE